MAAQVSRIAQLERLLGELSAENQELLNRENRYMSDEEEMLKQQESLSAQLSLFTTGAGVESMPQEELLSLERRLQETTKSVQKQIYFNQFMLEHAPQIAQDALRAREAEEKAKAQAGEVEPIAVVDPQTEAMRQQMEQIAAELAEVRHVGTLSVADVSRRIRLRVHDAHVAFVCLCCCACARTVSRCRRGSVGPAGIGASGFTRRGRVTTGPAGYRSVLCVKPRCHLSRACRLLLTHPTRHV